MTKTEEKTYLALWAFAKAPMILSGDIQFIGNVNETDSIAKMLNTSMVMQVNQDKLGHQCQEVENLNGTGMNDTLGYYSSLNRNKTDNQLYYALLIVNWYDENLTVNTKFDLKAAGISLTPYDNCEMLDLWTGKKSTGMGGMAEFPTANLAKHDHVAFKIVCSPF